MTTIKCGEIKVPGGFFVMAEKDSLSYSWNDSPAAEEIRFLGTYKNSGTPLKDELLKMIRGAKHRIFIASFMLGDDELVGEIGLAAKRLKGGVYLITALDKRSLEKGLEEYDRDDRQPPEQRKKDFERLTSAGVYVRGHGSCHAKFAVVDNEVALLGSANFVSGAFDWTGEANFLVRNPFEVSQLSKLFTLLWYEGCGFEVPPGKVYKVAKRQPEKAPAQPITPRICLTEPGLVWTNGKQSMSLLDSIHLLIESAENDLLLATYSFTGMFRNSKLLLDPLKRAIDRGVRCRMFIRQKNTFPDQLEELRMLSELGVDIAGDLRNHAKAVIADEKSGVLFSANFDANHGLDSGVEIGMTIGESEALRGLKTYLQHAISNADARFVVNPKQDELDGKLVGRWCKKWPFAPTMNVEIEVPNASSIIRALENSPVMFTTSGSKTPDPEQAPCKLLVDGMTFEAVVSDSTMRIDKCDPTGVSINSQIVQQLKSPRFSRSKSDELNGFCTADLNFQSLT